MLLVRMIDPAGPVAGVIAGWAVAAVGLGVLVLLGGAIGEIGVAALCVLIFGATLGLGAALRLIARRRAAEDADVPDLGSVSRRSGEDSNGQRPWRVVTKPGC